MTKRTASHGGDYSSSSSRDYNGNPSNLETAVAEDYNPQIRGIKPIRRKGNNHYADLARKNGDDLALRAYLSELPRYPPASIEGEIDLARRIAEGDEDAKARLIEANQRFVVSVAKNYQHMGLSLSELISAGNIGLLEAIERFDITRGFKFISYAVWWIRNEITKELTERSGRIDDSEQTRFLREVSALRQRLGRDPTVYEIEVELGLGIKRVERRLYGRRAPVSIDRKEGDDSSLLDILHSDDPTPEEICDEEEKRELICRGLDTLSMRERKIVEWYFGLNGSEPKTLPQIGRIMGVTRERVRQIRNKGLKKLRESGFYHDYKD